VRSLTPTTVCLRQSRRCAGFSPIDGQSVESSSGNVALGLARHNVSVTANGSGSGQSSDGMNLVCQGGPDGSLDVLTPASASHRPVPRPRT